MKDPQFFLTDKQLLVNDWIQSMGFITDLEVVLGKYCADIIIPELKAIVEIDWPSHYKSEMKKRDEELKRDYDIDHVVHIPVEIEKKEFENQFNDFLKKNFDDTRNNE